MVTLLIVAPELAVGWLSGERQEQRHRRAFQEFDQARPDIFDWTALNQELNTEYLFYHPEHVLISASLSVGHKLGGNHAKSNFPSDDCGRIGRSAEASSCIGADPVVNLCGQVCLRKTGARVDRYNAAG